MVVSERRRCGCRYITHPCRLEIELMFLPLLLLLALILINGFYWPISGGSRNVKKGGGAAEDNVSVSSSFIAHVHNELYDFIRKKATYCKNCEPIGGGGRSSPFESATEAYNWQAALRFLRDQRSTHLKFVQSCASLHFLAIVTSSVAYCCYLPSARLEHWSRDQQVRVQSPRPLYIGGTRRARVRRAALQCNNEHVASVPHIYRVSDVARHKQVARCRCFTISKARWRGGTCPAAGKNRRWAG